MSGEHFYMLPDIVILYAINFVILECHEESAFPFTLPY